MSRAYRKAQPRAHRPLGSWVSFISGLTLGLFVALAVYLRSGSVLDEKPQARKPFDAEHSQAVVAATPKPKFDFYKILPEVEVKVNDTEIAAPTEKSSTLAPATNDHNTAYVIQVGSFQRYEQADKAKAQLALQGIQANIQRVVINGQDIWYRVHVGPYAKVADVQAMRARLSAAGMTHILLKIGGDPT